MRKFSKILTVFLTVCLLVGVVIATVVSAETSSTITKIKEYANGKSYSTSLTETDMATYYQHSGTVSGDSKYLMYRGSNAADFNNYDYVVWDLDFMADQYLDADGKLTTDADKAVKLSYLHRLRFYHARFSKTGHICYFVEDSEGKWYISANNSYSKDDIPLKNEAGFWNHFTLVIDVNKKFVYMYVNGQYLSSAATDEKQLATTDTYFYVRPQSSSNGSFSIGIDNVKETGFNVKDDYKIDSDIDCIADYFGGETVDTTLPLYVCDDMVYNMGYTYENAIDEQYPVFIDTVNDDPVGYLFVEKAVDVLSKMPIAEVDNAKVITTKSIYNFTPPKGLNSLTIVAKDGAEFTLSQEAKDNCYSVTPFENEDGSVTYTVKVGEFANIVFVDDNGNVLATKPSLIEESLKTLDVQVPVTYLNNGKYKFLDHWVMKDANGEETIEFNGNGEIIRSDYVFYASDVYTPGVNSIVVKAVYTEERLSFAVLTKSTNSLVLTEEISQDKYFDSNNIAKCVNAAEEEVTLVLHDDASLASTDSLAVKANATLNVDLNGNTLSQNGGVMFTVNDGATLNVTSSAKGAEIEQTADDANPVLIAGADNAKSYNINIVNEDKKEITVSAGTLIDIKGGGYNAETKKFSATDDAPVVINIVGGIYVASAEPSGPVFNIATTEVKLNITNAVVGSMVNGAIFASQLAGDVDFADADITVSGTALYADGYNSATVLGAFGKDVAIEISDSKIIGDIFGEKVNGAVTLGEYTYIQLGSNAIKYTEAALVEDLVIAENCAPVRANLYDEEFDVYYGIVLLDEAIVEENTVTVTWLDPNGEVFATEEWLKGSTAVGYDTSDFGVLTDTKNGWYTLGYASWEDENAVDLKYHPDYTLDEDVTFRPVKGLVASVAVKVNMSLLTKFEANLYIPLITPENVEILGLFTHYDAAYGVNYLYHVDESALEYAMIDGMEYVKHSFYFNNSDIDKSVTRYLAIEVDGEVMVQKIKVDLLGYANAVMEQYGCSSEEAVLAYNLINYSHEAYKFKTEGVEYAPAAEFLALEDHDIETCGCYFGYDYDLDEVSLNYKEGLGENVYGVSYDISNEMPAFVVYAKTDKTGASLVKRVKVQFYGINSSVDDTMFEYNLTLVSGDDVVIDGKTYATFSFKSMPLYNAAEVMTVTVTNADGTEYTGTYSLATYIDHFICYPADDSGLEVAKALYSFAKVANGYKNLAD